MDLNIFVSYSHEDEALVKPVVSLLRVRQGLVFLDRDRIEPGKKWRDELDTALNDASLIVIFWCRHSEASFEVRNGIRDSVLHARKMSLPSASGCHPPTNRACRVSMD